MCGIFGYYNYRVPRSRQDIVDCLLTGLRRLEYRGYDSAGLSVDAAPAAAAAAGGDPLSPAPGSAAKSPAAAAAGVSLAAAAAAAAGVSPAAGAPAANGDAPPPLVFKSSGKIDALQALAYAQLAAAGADMAASFDVHAGIAHTRWATHGPPTAANAHPHVSTPRHEFVVVHNGIITNHKALKDFLLHRGEVFVSDTDTEVIPKLCRYVAGQLPAGAPLATLVAEVMQHLEGAYALLVKSALYPGEMVACKRGSPLILGVRAPASGVATIEGVDVDAAGAHASKRRRAATLECFLASDASAVVEHTNKVVVLEDGDVLAVAHGEYAIYNVGERPGDAALAAGRGGAGAGAAPPRAAPRALQTLEMEVSQIMKGGWDHYMAKEIHEQPESTLQTMRGRVKLRGDARASPAPEDAYREKRIKLGGLADHLATVRAGRRLVFVACGTSFHACLAARKTVEELAELPVALELASDMLDRRVPVFRDDTCVFVSQSGETADTLRALEYCKARGALCVGVTNTVGSAIARGTHCGIHINAGAEIGVASTKAYTSQVVAITLMALALCEDSISKRDARDEVIDDLGALPDAIRGALALDAAMKDLAARLRDEQSLLVFGRGYNYATALEAALKVKEVALMHAEGILAGEMKHGPLALVDDKMPIFVIATQDDMHAKMLSVIEQLRARSAQLVVLACEGDDEVADVAGPGTTLIRVPRVADALQPVVNIVPLQLLAYHLTTLRGFDVDQPRNLAKSVTVTEDPGRRPDAKPRPGSRGAQAFH